MTNKFTMQLLVGLALTVSAAAQSEVLRAIYDASATIQTNIEV